MMSVVLGIGRFLVFLFLVLFEQSLFLFQLFEVRYGGRVGDRGLLCRRFIRWLAARRFATAARMVVLVRTRGGR